MIRNDGRGMTNLQYSQISFLTSLVKITGGIDMSSLMVERLVHLCFSLGPPDIGIISSTSK